MAAGEGSRAARQAWESTSPKGKGTSLQVPNREGSHRSYFSKGLLTWRVDARERTSLSLFPGDAAWETR